MLGAIHLYYGEGKGKTTAALGLALRMAGAGKSVWFCQFLKDGQSSEMALLATLPRVTIDYNPQHHGFFRSLNQQQRAATIAANTRLLRRGIRAAQQELDLLVLDEALSACRHQAIAETELLAFLRNKPPALEVVLTGRQPSAALLAVADYITEMKKIKHPYDQGVAARLGVEY